MAKQNIYQVPDPITPRWYNSVYLSSAYWRWRRRQYMKLAGYRCEIHNCTRPATQIHHLSYDNLYCEPNNDLMALCRDCHAWMHKWPANDNLEQLMLKLERPKAA